MSLDHEDGRAHWELKKRGRIQLHMACHRHTECEQPGCSHG